MILYDLYAYFYVLFNSVFIFPAWRKNRAGKTEREKEEHGSFKVVTPGVESDSDSVFYVRVM